jgi:hypothetical protein
MTEKCVTDGAIEARIIERDNGVRTKKQAKIEVGLKCVELLKACCTNLKYVEDDHCIKLSYNHNGYETVLIYKYHNFESNDVFEVWGDSTDLDSRKLVYLKHIEDGFPIFGLIRNDKSDYIFENYRFIGRGNI